MIFRKSAKEILEQDDPFIVVNDLSSRLRKSKMTFDHFTHHQKVFWTVRVLFSETNNGTIEQWAANSSGNLYRETSDSLNAIGAHEAILLIERFNSLIDLKMSSDRDVRIDQIEHSRRNNPNFEDEVRCITKELREANRSVYQSLVSFLRIDPSQI